MPVVKDHGILFARILSALQNEKILDDEQTTVAQNALPVACEAVRAVENNGGANASDVDGNVNKDPAVENKGGANASDVDGNVNKDPAVENNGDAKASDESDNKGETIDINDFDKDDTQIFDENIGKILAECKDILEIFHVSRETKDNFFNKFSSARKLAERIVKDLRTIAADVQSDKITRDKVRAALNGIAAVAAALAILCPPAAVAGVAVCGVANVAAAGVTVRENFYVHAKKEEAGALIEEVKESYTAMRYFSCPEEMEKRLNRIVDSTVLKRLTTEMNIFSEKVRKEHMTEKIFKENYEKVLSNCMTVLARDGRVIEKYGKDLAPVVMSFLFVVVLLDDHNRIVLDCSFKTLHEISCLTGVLNLAVPACQVLGSIYEVLSYDLIPWIQVTVNSLLSVYYVWEVYKKRESELAKQINEKADKIEEIFKHLNTVYEETKQYKSHEEIAEWKTFMVYHIPDNATSADLKKAFQHYLPEKVKRRIRTYELPTKGNNWMVAVPASDSKIFKEMKNIIIKEKSCDIS